MATFVQLHLLTSYPPACLNRDDLNRPKTAVMGGMQRLRVSSQSLKRAWRTSDLFHAAVMGNMGIRTKELGHKVELAIRSGKLLEELLRIEENIPIKDDISESDAKEWAWAIASTFVDKAGGNDSQESKKTNVNRDTLKSEQLVFYSKPELEAINELIQVLRKEKHRPTKVQLSRILLPHSRNTVDLALFGRMLASSTQHGIEAACEVAHAITVHKVAVEDDYFTAVDDLNTRQEDVGSAHIGEQGFAAGLFYLYVCINRDLLQENLSDDAGLTQQTLRALTEAAATVAPGGKQKSFGSRAYASYILAEKDSRQPCSLAVAFLKPVREGDMLRDAITALASTRVNMDKVYYNGQESASRVLNALEGTGSLDELLNFVAQP